MNNKYRHLFHVLSAVILCAGYLVIRYALFELHGMKEWPFDLFAGCLAVLIISYIGDFRTVSLVTAVSYGAGFLLGLLLHKTTIDDIRGSMDNLWIIWLGVITAAVILSVILEIIRGKKKVIS